MPRKKETYPTIEDLKIPLKGRKPLTPKQARKALSNLPRHHERQREIKSERKYSNVNDLRESMKYRKPFVPQDYDDSEPKTRFNEYGEIIENPEISPNDLTKKIIGSLMFFIGIAFILNSFSSITGFAVAESIGRGISGILGLVLIGGGVVLFVSGLEKRIRVYQYPNKEGDESYYLDDPENLFGNTGTVNFLDILRESKTIKEDQELLGYAKKHYGVPLINYIDKEGEHSEIAKRCLSALGIDYFEDKIEKKRELNSEITIARSREFRRSSKGVPKKVIEDTITKIETGLADVHNLSGDRSGTKAINATKGDRITYKVEGNKVTLIDYVRSHDY